MSCLRLAAAGLLLAVAGCGGNPTRAAMHRAQTTHEYPVPRVAPPAVPGASAAPEEAIRSFALAYINWSASDVVSDLNALAARSIGQAHSAMQLQAARAAGDYELQRAGVANVGTVEAIAPLAGRPGTFIVVTRERTVATDTAAYQGLRPAWHVAVASVMAMKGGGFAVSRWQPES